MSKPPSTASAATMLQRKQVAQAVMQGYLDSAISSDLSTAKTNGYIPDQVSDFHPDNAPIAGVNR